MHWRGSWSLRVAFAIVDPFGRPQSLIGGAPVEETCIDVQGVQQVGRGAYDPGRREHGFKTDYVQYMAAQWTAYYSKSTFFCFCN